MIGRSLNTTIFIFIIVSAITVFADLRATPAQSNNTPTPSAVAGIWTAQDVSYPPWTFALRSNGSTLTGTVSQGRYNSAQTRVTALAQPVPIYDGTVSGNAISFKCHSPGSADRTITFTGQINDNEIMFTRTVEVRPGGDPGEDGIFGLSGAQHFVAQREVGPPAQQAARGPVGVTILGLGERPPGTVRPDLGVRVRALPDGNYEYTYSVRNGEASQDAIASWHLDVPTFANLKASAPSGCQPSTSVSRPGTENLRSMAPGSHLIHWVADGASQNGSPGKSIQAGSVVDGFQVISKDRPGFVTAYFQGGDISSGPYANRPERLRSQPDAATSVTEARASQMTLGPQFDANSNLVATVMEFSREVQLLTFRGGLNPNTPFMRELLSLLEDYRRAAGEFHGSAAEFVGPPLVVRAEPGAGLESEVALAFRLSIATPDSDARKAMGIDPARPWVQQQEQVVQRDMNGVRRIQLSTFPDLPAQFRMRLEQRGCIVPLGGEPFIRMGNGEQQSQPPNNVLTGEFARKGQTDWATICSVGSQSSILIFWGGPALCPDELAIESNSRYVSRNSEGIPWFSRIISKYSHQGIEEWLRPSEAGGYTGGTIPPDFATSNHDGIADGERYGYTTFVYYCSEGRWFTMKFTGE